MDGRIAYQIVSMLRDVVQRGTGVAAKVLEREDVGGKTGSTNDHRDAWFSGFGGPYVTTVWVGRDDFTSLGYREYGGKAALPIWINYMRVALKDQPIASNEPPEGMVKVSVSASGALLPEGSGGVVEWVKAEDLDRMETYVDYGPQDAAAGRKNRSTSSERLRPLSSMARRTSVRLFMAVIRLSTPASGSVAVGSRFRFTRAVLALCSVGRHDRPRRKCSPSSCQPRRTSCATPDSTPSNTPRPAPRAPPQPRPRSRATDGRRRHPRLPPGQAQGRAAAGHLRRRLAAAEPRDRGRAARVPAPVPARQRGRTARSAAKRRLRALDFFASFEPRLVGPVLDGTADAHSAIALHLHSDDPEAAHRFLEQHGIPAESRNRRIRLDRERAETFRYGCSAPRTCPSTSPCYRATCCGRRRCRASTRSR